MKIKTIYKNRLPHIAPFGATFFVTFRLKDSLPQHIIKELKTKMDNAIEKLKKEKPPNYKVEITKQRKLFFKSYDHQLDHKPFGSCFLKLDPIANIIKEKLHELDGEKYELLAYCIMPNHVHLLFDTSIQLVDEDNFYLNEIPENYVQLHQIMKKIKGGTAVAINRHLSRNGAFWQKDSYDHYIRNNNEFDNILNYILQNPVKAGLSKNWEDFPHSFIKNFNS